MGNLNYNIKKYKINSLEVLLGLIHSKLLIRYRNKKLLKLIYNDLIDSPSILSVGCGTGFIENYIASRNKKIKIKGIDVLVPEKTYIKVKKYDGKKIPFKSNSFDVVMFLDVLHHTDNIKDLMSEAKRVTKKIILIKDHYYDTKFDHFLLRMADYIGNKGLGINLNYNYLKESEWRLLIKQLNLKIIKFKKFKYNCLHPSKNIILKLNK
ncbi:MAG: class I SAM-dependent methyltransferase [Nanoarchaeota archaeon]